MSKFVEASYDSYLKNKFYFKIHFTNLVCHPILHFLLTLIQLHSCHFYIFAKSTYVIPNIAEIQPLIF